MTDSEHLAEACRRFAKLGVPWPDAVRMYCRDDEEAARIVIRETTMFGAGQKLFEAWDQFVEDLSNEVARILRL